MRGERLHSSRGDLVRARSLIGALRQQGHEVDVVEDAQAPLARLRVSFYRRVVRSLLPLPAARWLRDTVRPWHARRYARRLVFTGRRQQPEILVETDVAFAASGSLASKRLRLPLVLDDCSPVEEEEALGSGLLGKRRRLLARQCRAAAAVVCSSEEIAERLRPLVPSERKLLVVSNGVDIAAFSPVRRPSLRAELGVDRRLVIVFVGSFQPWHAADRLLVALDGIDRALPWHLLLIGCGPGHETTLLEAAARNLSDRVTSLGAVPHDRVPDLLGAADLAVLPGTNDYGDPMKLAEYAAAALPIVAPDLPPVRQRVEDGITGTLFSPSDLPAFTVAIDRYLRDEALRRRHGTAARLQLARTSSWEHAAASLATVLREAVSRQ